MMLEKSNRESPTAFLMRVMEDFSQAEPVKVVVIFTAEDGSLQVSTNKIERTATIGMLVQAQQLILNDWLLNKRET